MNSVKTSKFIRLAACALLCLALSGAAVCASSALSPQTLCRESVVEPGDLGQPEEPGLPGEPADAQPGDGADASAPEDGQVLGLSDEKPGVGVFWAIVIALFVAGAVVFGIVLVIPHDGEDPA